MSRIAKMGVAVPQGVDVQIKEDQITVKGSGGELKLAPNDLVKVTAKDGALSFEPANETREANAMSGTLAYIRQKRVLFSAAVPFAIATLPGAVLGSWIVNKFSTPMLDLYFGIFLLLMSIIMYWNSTHKPVSNIMELPKDFQYNRTLGIVASLGVGFLSSIFGIGGGVIHVPLMIYLLGFPVHVATATSHFVLACSSAFGVISHFMLDHIIWIPAICISIGAAIGAQIGAKLSKKTKSKVILMLLSLAMFALGIRLILLGSAH